VPLQAPLDASVNIFLLLTKHTLTPGFADLKLGVMQRQVLYVSDDQPGFLRADGPAVPVQIPVNENLLAYEVPVDGASQCAFHDVAPQYSGCSVAPALDGTCGLMPPVGGTHHLSVCVAMHPAKTNLNASTVDL
jgi:hypothetical protein